MNCCLKIFLKNELFVVVLRIHSCGYPPRWKSDGLFVKMKFLFQVLLILATGELSAQTDRPKITAEYSNTTFVAAVADLERKYPLTFLFDSSWVDSLYILLKAEQIELDIFLDQLLQGTELHSYVTEDYRIILTQDHDNEPELKAFIKQKRLKLKTSKPESGSEITQVLSHYETLSSGESMQLGDLN